MDKLAINLKKSQGRLIDETGNKYNKLYVIEYAGSGKKYKGGYDGGAAWHCRCDCGNMVIALGTKLRRGVIKSCGCSNHLQKGQASFNGKFKQTIASAKIRGYDWELSKKQFKQIIDLPCVYCGQPPSNVANGNTCNGSYICSGIDRINNNNGYVIDNVVPCCVDCNKAKATKTVSGFLNWIKRLIAHNKWDCDIDMVEFIDKNIQYHNRNKKQEANGSI